MRGEGLPRTVMVQHLPRFLELHRSKKCSRGRELKKIMMLHGVLCYENQISGIRLEMYFDMNNDSGNCGSAKGCQEIMRKRMKDTGKATSERTGRKDKG